MGGPGRQKDQPPKPAGDRPKQPDKPDHVPAEDDDFEDGDFATPKHDRDDGEQL